MRDLQKSVDVFGFVWSFVVFSFALVSGAWILGAVVLPSLAFFGYYLFIA